LNIVLVTGTRPQLIKTALLDRRLRQEHDMTMVHTGQHYDNYMSSNFFKELDIPQPDINLGIKAEMSHQQLGKTIEALGNYLNSLFHKPDLVIIIGNTSTALAGALAASKLHMPIAHVEAGTRCGDRSVPEEVNRILVDHLSDLLFCSSNESMGNLINKEGLSHGVYFTGDVLYDTYLHYSQQVGPKLCDVFVTIHREANVDNADNLFAIGKAINSLKGKVVFPVHPRTEKMSHISITLSNNIVTTPPISYLDTIAYIKGAKLVITDSGGIQREAYFAKVPCIYIGTAGNPELVACGATIQVLADTDEILDTARTFSNPQFPESLLGYGNAVENIVGIIREWES